MNYRKVEIAPRTVAIGADVSGVDLGNEIFTRAIKHVYGRLEDGTYQPVVDTACYAGLCARNA